MEAILFSDRSLTGQIFLSKMRANGSNAPNFYSNQIYLYEFLTDQAEIYHVYGHVMSIFNSINNLKSIKWCLMDSMVQVRYGTSMVRDKYSSVSTVW